MQNPITFHCRLKDLFILPLGGHKSDYPACEEEKDRATVRQVAVAA
jgi:hypothetical protein